MASGSVKSKFVGEYFMLSIYLFYDTLMLQDKTLCIELGILHYYKQIIMYLKHPYKFKKSTCRRREIKKKILLRS